LAPSLDMTVGSLRKAKRGVGNVSNIHGKLLKLGVDVSQDAAQMPYSWQLPGSPSGELTDLRRTLREFADGHL